MDQPLLHFSVILLILNIVFLFAWMFLYYALLSRIKQTHPKYYKQLDSPFLPQMNRHMTQGVKHDGPNYAFMRDLCKRNLKDFPKDDGLRRLAGQVRWSILLSIGFFLANITVFLAVTQHLRT